VRLDGRIAIAVLPVVVGCGGKVVVGSDLVDTKPAPDVTTIPDAGHAAVDHPDTGPTDAPGCSATQTSCGGKCVSTASDKANCGGCGLLCSATCNTGHCITTLASGLRFPAAIAVDDSHVYWATWGFADGIGKPVSSSGNVARLPLRGGAVETLVSGDVAAACIAIDAMNVYYMTSTEIMKLSKSGGAPIALATGQSSPSAVATDGVDVYWGNVGGMFQTWEAPVAGGTATQLLPTYGAPVAIALDKTGVYWLGATSESTSAVSRISSGDGRLALLSAVKGVPGAVVVDGANAYFTTASPSYGDSAVWQVPIGGGTATVLNRTQVTPGALAADATHLYCASVGTEVGYGKGSVVTIAKATGAGTVIASGQPSPVGIAVDATSIYWVNAGTYPSFTDGAILRTDKD
jgi:hypothetical protein